MKRVLIVFIILVFVPAISLAQKAGQIGFNFEVGGFSSSKIGVTFHVTDRLAIRPTFSFSKSSEEFDALDDQTQKYVILDRETTRYGGGLDGLFYLNQGGDLRPYLGAGCHSIKMR
ncbi:MAG: hypothetical protein B6244_04090 [Candidatus Cloacimonetes bacterium 4572_55]|nr:MAG: hypothetical protein B6244_04090 [Candidatus Cloacimonetes bacterium 4572_55]